MRSKVLSIRAAVFLCLALGMGGCNDDAPVNVSLETKDATVLATDIHRSYSFGFDLRSSPQEDARQYLPFLKYLERVTGYRFLLHFTPKDGDIVKELGTGKLDFAAIGATSYLYAVKNSNYPLTPIARGLNLHNKASYRSYLVVNPESTITDISQLKGKRFAFGSKTSTQGHLIPRIILAKNHLTLQDLASYIYTGSHLNCANAVVAKKADVCGMQDTMAEAMQRRGLVKILYRSDEYPSSGIVANNQVPRQAIAKVREALLNFKPQGKHSSMLYNWHKTEMPRGFITAMPEDYNALAKWMFKLGFIKQK